MASGCGDWDRLAQTWDLHRYSAMQRHWREVAPPLNLCMAALVGFRPRPARVSGAFDGDDFERAMAELFGG